MNSINNITTTIDTTSTSNNDMYGLLTMYGFNTGRIYVRDEPIYGTSFEEVLSNAAKEMGGIISQWREDGSYRWRATILQPTPDDNWGEIIVNLAPAVFREFIEEINSLDVTPFSFEGDEEIPFNKDKTRAIRRENMARDKVKRSLKLSHKEMKIA